jgi:hypothetical protein
MNGPHGGREALPHAALFEALGIVLLCFGWFVLGSVDAVSTWRPGNPTPGTAFTNARFVALVVVEIVMGTAALAVLRSRHYPLHTLYPHPSWRGVLVGGGLYLCATVIDAIVLPLVPHPAVTPLDEMVAGAHVTWPAAVLLSLVNGTYEEVFLLGYLVGDAVRRGARHLLPAHGQVVPCGDGTRHRRHGGLR